MSNVQMFWSLWAECVEFFSQRKSGAVLMESWHGEGQTDKQGLYQRKRSDNLYSIRALMGSQWRVLRRDETWSRLWALRTSLASCRFPLPPQKKKKKRKEKESKYWLQNLQIRTDLALISEALERVSKIYPKKLVLPVKIGDFFFFFFLTSQNYLVKASNDDEETSKEISKTRWDVRQQRKFHAHGSAV